MASQMVAAICSERPLMRASRYWTGSPPPGRQIGYQFIGNRYPDQGGNSAAQRTVQSSAAVGYVTEPDIRSKAEGETSGSARTKTRSISLRLPLNELDGSSGSWSCGNATADRKSVV